MSEERLVEILSPECLSELLRSLEVRITAQLVLPGEEHYPPGAVDYMADVQLSWYPEDQSEADVRILESIAGDGDSEDVRFHVGQAHLVVVDLLAPELFDALDAREADLAYLGEILFPTGRSDDQYEIEDELDSAQSHAILVNSVEIDGRWRGMKLGLLATGTALEELGRGCSFAALDAMQPGAKSTEQRQSIHKRLSWYWRQLGFNSWRERVMVLDLGNNELSDSMARLTQAATS